MTHKSITGAPGWRVNHESMHPHDPTKASRPVQIANLKASMAKNVNRVANLHKAGRHEQAVHVCCIVANQKQLIWSLLLEESRASLLPAMPALEPREPQRKGGKKRHKVYKRWSVK